MAMVSFKITGNLFVWYEILAESRLVLKLTTHFPWPGVIFTYSFYYYLNQFCSIALGSCNETLNKSNVGRKVVFGFKDTDHHLRKAMQKLKQEPTCRYRNRCHGETLFTGLLFSLPFLYNPSPPA